MRLKKNYLFSDLILCISCQLRLSYIYIYIYIYIYVCVCVCVFVCLFLTKQPPQWAMASSFTRFLDHTQRRTTVGRTPLDEWSARRSYIYVICFYHLIVSYEEQKQYLFGPTERRSIAYWYWCKHEFSNDKFVPMYAIGGIDPLIPKLGNIWRKVSFMLQPLPHPPPPPVFQETWVFE